MENFKISSNELKTLSCIRSWRHTNQSIGALHEIERSIHQFIDFLWESDPFLVEINLFEVKQISLFEMQLLTVISDCFTENWQKVDQLLDWWFSPISYWCALFLMKDIRSALAEQKLLFDSRKWVEDHCLFPKMSRQLSNDSNSFVKNTTISPGLNQQLHTVH